MHAVHHVHQTGQTNAADGACRKCLRSLGCYSALCTCTRTCMVVTAAAAANAAHTRQIACRAVIDVVASSSKCTYLQIRWQHPVSTSDAARAATCPLQAAVVWRQCWIRHHITGNQTQSCLPCNGSHTVLVTPPHGQQCMHQQAVLVICGFAVQWLSLLELVHFSSSRDVGTTPLQAQTSLSCQHDV